MAQFRAPSNDNAACQPYAGEHGPITFKKCMADRVEFRAAQQATEQAYSEQSREEAAQTRLMLMRAGAVLAAGAAFVPPPQPVAPLPNILPPPPVHCTSWRDYMGTVHTTCQ